MLTWMMVRKIPKNKIIRTANITERNWSDRAVMYPDPEPIIAFTILVRQTKELVPLNFFYILIFLFPIQKQQSS